MFKTILGSLFVTYREPGKLSWASRWMHRHGRLLIGDPTPQLEARNIHPELIKSYYFAQVDRQIGAVNDLRKWRFDSLFVNAYRRYEERHVALRTSLVSLVMCVVVLAGAAPVYGYKSAVDFVRGIGCESYVQDVDGGAIDRENVDQDRLRFCRARVKAAEAEKQVIETSGGES